MSHATNPPDPFLTPDNGVVEPAPDALAIAIRGVCWNNTELLGRNRTRSDDDHPLTGHCFVASEAYHHISGRDTTPMQTRHNGASHWYLHDEANDVYIDLTHEQFDTPVDYDAGRGRGFGTHGPVGKRTARLIQLLPNEVV